MPIASFGMRFARAPMPAVPFGFSCCQISAPMPAPSHPISPNAAKGPMPNPKAKPDPANATMPAPTAAQISTGRNRAV